MTDYFPTGWSHYLGGGIVIGVATALVFLLTGVRAGASGFFTTACSYLSSRDCFRAPWALRERSWRSLFTIGIFLGAAVFTLAFAHEAFVTRVQWWRLLIGGVLVGYGTRLSRGCTSGHGICGLSGGARSSLVAVLTFMGVAIATAWGAARLGISP